MDPDEEHRRKAREYAQRCCDALPRLLREARAAAGLTGYRLAARTGISRSTISRIEGGTEEPGLYRMAQLTWVIGTSLSRLFAAGRKGGVPSRKRKKPKTQKPPRSRR